MSNIAKGYKQTEVGVIPEDWEVKSLNTISSSVASGKSKNKSEAGIFTVFGSTGIIGFNSSYDYEGQKILVARVGANAGTTNIVDGKYCVSDNTLIVDLKKDTDFLFVFYFLKHSHLNNIIFGSGQPLITGSQLKDLNIPLPPTKAEQTAIAEALSDANALISRLEKLIAKKRNIKQGAMQELLKPKDNWAMKKLGDILTFSGGYSASREQLSNEGFCYLHYGDIHGAKKTFINVKNEYTEIPKLNISLKNISPKSLLNDGDIVFVDASEDDEGTSRHLIVKNPDGIPYISGLHTIVAKSTGDSLDNDFKRYCFQTKVVKSQFKFYAVGTKVSGISKTNIAKIEIAIPPKSEQTRIAAIISDMDAEIEVLEQKLNKYRQIKQGMMQDLLTGKTRLV